MKTWKRTRAKPKEEEKRVTERSKATLKKKKIDRPSPKLYIKGKKKNKSKKE